MKTSFCIVEARTVRPILAAELFHRISNGKGLPNSLKNILPYRTNCGSINSFNFTEFWASEAFGFPLH